MMSTVPQENLNSNFQIIKNIDNKLNQNFESQNNINKNNNKSDFQYSNNTLDDNQINKNDNNSPNYINTPLNEERKEEIFKKYNTIEYQNQQPNYIENMNYSLEKSRNSNIENNENNYYKDDTYDKYNLTDNTKKILDSFSQTNYNNREYSDLITTNSETRRHFNYNNYASKFNDTDETLKNQLIYKYSNYEKNRPHITIKKNYSSPILSQTKNIFNNINKRNYSNYINNDNYNINDRNTNYYSSGNRLNNNINIYNSNDNEIMKYEDEIKQLKEEISNLRSNNETLQNQVKNLETDNSKLKENENLLLKIMTYLNLNSTEEIIPKLNEIFSLIDNNNNVNNNNKGNNIINNNQEDIKEELIRKLKGIYISLTGSNPNQEIDIKTLWRWIKHLINTVKQLALEKEKNSKNGQNDYKQYCEQLMVNFNLKSFKDLTDFLDNVLYQKDKEINDEQNANQNYSYNY